jgi:transcriptional regulator
MKILLKTLSQTLSKKHSFLMSKFTLMLIFTTILISVSMVSISCKSAPPASEEAPVTSEPEPVQETQPEVSQPSTQQIDQLLVRAEEARKLAMDFESPAYFPSDWEVVEAQFTQTRGMPKSNDNEVQQVITSLNSIVGIYQELFKKTIPLYAQAWEDEVMTVRDHLLGTGLKDVFQEYFEKADQIALTALDQYDAEDYYIARDTAATALNEYETLYLGARVFSRRQEIIDRNFLRYDAENFDKADIVAETALDQYEAGDTKAAKEYAEEALLRYNLILSNSWAIYVIERKATANDERNLAIQNKVNIAVREAFREAEHFFILAEESYSEGKLEEAAIFYTEAEALFAIAGQETEYKRQRAMETIRIAEERIEGSIETAIEADRILEGGSR